MKIPTRTIPKELVEAAIVDLTLENPYRVI